MSTISDLQNNLLALQSIQVGKKKELETIISSLDDLSTKISNKLSMIYRNILENSIKTNPENLTKLDAKGEMGIAKSIISKHTGSISDSIKTITSTEKPFPHKTEWTSSFWASDNTEIIENYSINILSILCQQINKDFEPLGILVFSTSTTLLKDYLWKNIWEVPEISNRLEDNFVAYSKDFVTFSALSIEIKRIDKEISDLIDTIDHYSKWENAK